MQLGRHGEGDRVDLAEQLPVVGDGRRAAARPQSRAARGSLVSTTADQLDAGQRRQDPRVMLAEWPTPMTAMRTLIACHHEHTKTRKTEDTEIAVLESALLVSSCLAVRWRITLVAGRRWRCPLRRRPR